MNWLKLARSRRGFASCVGALLAVGLAWIPSGAEGGGGGGAQAVFLGAAPGIAIPWKSLALPGVVEGPFNEPTSLASPFAPHFDDLVNGQLIITSEPQWRHIWRRLFNGVPYDPNLVDFESDYVILTGGGKMHPFVGFGISEIELFDGTFSPVMDFDGPHVESALAVRVITWFPGANPPDMDPEWKISAVSVPRKFMHPVLLNRQAFFGI